MPLNPDELADRLNRFMPPTGVLLGLKVLQAEPEAGRVRIRYFAKPEFCNPMGKVQGGIIAAMLDDAAALACIVKAAARIVVPTLEFKVSFFAAAPQGELFAEGYCRKLGRTITFLEAGLYDAAGLHLAQMTATAMIKPLPDNPNFVSR